jgi:hypothetical protein
MTPNETLRPSSSSRPKRGWLRYSLRTLLVATTVLCIWLGIKVNSARRQHDAVNAILKSGGEVVFDYQMVPEGKPREFLLDPIAAPSEPAWLLKWLSLDYFHEVVGVVLGPEHAIPKTDFVRLADLRKLIRLQLAGAKIVLPDGGTRLIQAADLPPLGTFHGLRELMIDHAEIDGTCVTDLAANLKVLALAVTHVDDAGMLQIGKLTDLEVLRLASTLITDTGVKQLYGLQRLSYLDIRDTAVTDAGIREIGKLNALKAIAVGGTCITDVGLKQIAGLVQLSDIDLNNTTITDESIGTLAAFPNLLRVNLEYTRVTPGGVQRLQQFRPKLKILIMPGQFQQAKGAKADGTGESLSSETK